jgi:hypothetical protein
MPTRYELPGSGEEDEFGLREVTDTKRNQGSTYSELINRMVAKSGMWLLGTAAS